MENQLAPVSLTFLYFRTEFFELVLIPGAKCDGYWSTWTMCFLCSVKKLPLEFVLMDLDWRAFFIYWPKGHFYEDLYLALVRYWVFAYRRRFMKIRSLLRNIEVGIVKNGCGNSVLRGLKLVVSQGGINDINWYLMCWYKFRKAKSYFNNLWVVLVKNGRGLLVPGTLKHVASQESINQMSWFFACWYKFRAAKSYFNNYWSNMVQNGLGFRDHGTVKSGVSQIWFDELSRSIR